jgi:integrase
MSRLYKKTLYRPVPVGATFLESEDGTKYAVWMAAGREKAAKYVETENGPRIVEESQVYIARYTDTTGRFRERSTGCRDLRAAEHQLNAWLQEVDRVKAGIVSLDELEVGKKMQGKITGYLPDFELHLKTKQATTNHILSTISRIKKVCIACHFVRMTDLNADILLRWLQDQTDHGMGARTRNSYRESINTFCNWAVDVKGCLRDNPFKKVPKVSEDVDVRHERRALTGEEIAQLFRAAEERPLHDATVIRRGKHKDTNKAEICDLTKREAERLGLERKLIYATLIYTGLRKNELTSITCGQVFLDDKIPHIYLKAVSAKSRKAAKLPLHPELLRQLKDWFALKKSEDKASPKEKLFQVPTALDKILNRDLAFAGIEKRDALDRVIDVHALRHTHATILAEQGVPITVVQQAMRHADLRMTMRYTHTKLESVSDGVSKFPDYLKKEDDEDDQAGAVVPC